jgi:arginyl-tRNA--protein-N-Asp/Glu arginylyltransferase
MRSKLIAVLLYDIYQGLSVVLEFYQPEHSGRTGCLK